MANSLQIIKFVGTVSTGQGHGKFFVEMPWVMQQLKEITGGTHYPGTLNIRLTSEYINQRIRLTRQNGVIVRPANGYSPGYLYNATIFNIKCFVVLPDVPNYPKDLLEIIATEKLRSLLNVKDGDKITLAVLL